MYSYNLSIQHELFQGTKLEVAYVGNQARHIRNSLPHNVAQPEGYTHTYYSLAIWQLPFFCSAATARQIQLGFRFSF